jgi:hypothetical protein
MRMALSLVAYWVDLLGDTIVTTCYGCNHKSSEQMQIALGHATRGS